MLRQLFEHHPLHARGPHTLRERQPQRRAVELEFEALGIAADTAPGAAGRFREAFRLPRVPQ